MKNFLMTVAFSALVLPVSSLSADEGGGLVYCAQSGVFRISQSDGRLLWRVRVPGNGTPTWRQLDDGRILLNNTALLDPAGRVLAELPLNNETPAQQGVVTLRDQAWEPLFQLTPVPAGNDADYISPLLADPSGNAWAINTHVHNFSDYELQVRHTLGISGAWSPWVTLSDSTAYVDQPEGAVDSQGNVTIVFRDIAANYDLYAVRYEPQTGWGPVERIYSTPEFFQAVEVAADAQGNVIAVFDPGFSPTSIWAIVYDAASGTWGNAQQVSPAGLSTELPTLCADETGNAVYLLYHVMTAGQIGLNSHRFDSQTLTFSPAEHIPGSEMIADGSFLTSFSRYPLTVSPAGEAMVFWESYDFNTNVFAVYANNTSGGTWQNALLMLDESPYYTDIENFDYSASGSLGDMMGVLTRYEGADGYRFWALTYDHQTGWKPPANPYTSDLSVTTRIRNSFYRDSLAVATFHGKDQGETQLVSTLYNGTDWIRGLIDIPGTNFAYEQEVTATRGKTLLVYAADGGTLGNIATWFHDGLPGDLDGDGDVDQADLGILLACYLTDPCGDLNGDGITDQADLGILLSNYN